MRRLLRSKYRKEMWSNARKIIKQIEDVLPISTAYVTGSFVTTKTRPADVDFIVLLKVNDRKQSTKWSVDLVIAPDNEYGNYVLKDAEKWMRQKYGRKNFEMIRLK